MWLRNGELHEGRTSGLDLERGMGVFLMKGSGEDIPEFGNGPSRVCLGEAKTFEQAPYVSDRAPGVGNGWGRREKY